MYVTYSTFRLIPTIFHDLSTLEGEDKALLWNLRKTYQAMKGNVVEDQDPFSTT